MLIGSKLVEDSIIIVGLGSGAHGIFFGPRTEFGLWPGDSIGCRSTVDSGLSGGLRVGSEGAGSTSVLWKVQS